MGQEGVTAQVSALLAEGATLEQVYMTYMAGHGAARTEGGRPS